MTRAAPQHTTRSNHHYIHFIFIDIGRYTSHRWMGVNSIFISHSNKWQQKKKRRQKDTEDTRSSQLPFKMKKSNTKTADQDWWSLITDQSVHCARSINFLSALAFQKSKTTKRRTKKNSILSCREISAFARCRTHSIHPTSYLVDRSVNVFVCVRKLLNECNTTHRPTKQRIKKKN